ncbi:uncharacterized protein PG986_003740 [Apiospora aurea]|uniref:Uncharacterized protein n=1 Tax=Apiospora aurea TaxID=335848 RepID=A0ABR1QSJ7_9PEZI
MDSPSLEKYVAFNSGDGESPGSLPDSSVDSDMLSIPDSDDLGPEGTDLNFGLDLEAVINSVASDLLERC